MASSNEDEAKLREQNSELVLKVQYWKMKAAQQETEKLELIKENNNLRLKISTLRNVGAAQARALDIAHQAASEQALSHLVQASSALTRTVELTKTYMRQREELEAASPRWSTLSCSPDNNKVHKVPPLLMGGKTIQPFVSLRRVPLNDNNVNLNDRNPNPNRNTNERVLPMPMHMLQDVYIPLRRLDASELLNHNSTESDNDEENAETNMLVEDNAEIELEESHEISEEDLDMSNQQLAAIPEDEQESDDEDDQIPNVRQPFRDNPLEGPSWLLDRPPSSKRRSRSCVTLEADSTTELEESRYTPSPTLLPMQPLSDGAGESRAFSPTVRRRKRTSSPPPELLSPNVSHIVSPRLPTHTHRNNLKSRISNSRVLKVLVPKMRLEVAGGDFQAARGDTQAARGGTLATRGDTLATRGDTLAARSDTPPAKRLASFDAPSPNGATDAAVIVMEQSEDSIVPPADESHDNSARSSSNHGSRSAANASATARTVGSDAHGSRTIGSDAHGSRTIGSDAHASRSTEDNVNARHSETRTVGTDAHASSRNLSELHASRTSREGHASRTSSVRISSEGHGSRTPGSDANVSVRSRPAGSDANVSVRSRPLGSNANVSARARPVGSDSNASSRSTGGRSSRDNLEGGEPSSRTRRPKKQVTYKEKPLNRKLRR